MSNDYDWLRQLQDDVGAWSSENFGESPLHGGDGSPPTHATIGIGEELGELTRSVLKRAQGIDDDGKYADDDTIGPEAEKDAVGDVMIYLLDAIHRSEDDIYVADAMTDRYQDDYPTDDATKAIKLLYSNYGDICRKRFYLIPDEEWEHPGEDGLDILEHDAATFAENLEGFCYVRGYDFEQCVMDAWAEVSGREWDSDLA